MFYSQNDLFEGEIKLKVNEIVESVRKNNNIIYLVTNEIGMGLVPSDKKTRLYRDLVGACNRKVAELADEVVLVCCGIPQRIKTIRDV